MDLVTCYWCKQDFDLEEKDDSGYRYLGHVGTVPICQSCYSELYGVLL